MIQRIQSLFLFLASCGFGLQYITDFFAVDSARGTLLSDKIMEVNDSPILQGVTIAGASFALIAIFLYNNRKLQQILSTLSIIMALATFAAIALALHLDMGLESMEGTSLIIKAGIFLPIISAICGFLANKYIGKDEKLVKSMDRLR
jgi:hypothetical protein